MYLIFPFQSKMAKSVTEMESKAVDKAFLAGNMDQVLSLIKKCDHLNTKHLDEIVQCSVQYERSDVLLALTEKGIDANYIYDSNGTTLLHIASDKGDIDLVKLLLRRGADVNARTHDLHHCPIHMAIMAGHRDVINELVKAGSKITHYSQNGYAPLHLATLGSYKNIVEMLLGYGVDVNMVSGHGNSSLHIAVMEQAYEVAKLLLGKGANVDAKNDSGWCPLHCAVEGGQVKFVEVLLQYGAHINSLTTFVLYRTPLMLAANLGLSQIVKLLLANGAATDIVTQYGETALHLAVIERHLSVVKLLIENNVNLEVVTNLNVSAIHFASKSKDVAMLTLLLRSGAEIDSYEKAQLCLGLAVDACDLELISLCMKQGASPNVRLSVCGQTALHRAVRRGRKELVELLLQMGADPNSATEDCGETPLHVAAYGEAENEDLMKLLIRHGADVDAIFEQCHWTALTMVMENGHEGCTRLLLDNGADVTGRTDNGEMALHIAAREGFSEGVRLLLDKDTSFTIFARDRDGDMPHHKTVYGDHQMALQVLLQNGCPLNIEDGTGETALEHAISAKSFGCSVLLLIHGAVFDDILLEYILSYERDTMINMIEMFLCSGNIDGDAFQALYSLLRGLPQKGDQKTFCDQIKKRVKTDLNLKMVVRIALRRHLNFVIGNKSMVSAIKALPLPRVLKEYLLLKDHSEFLETEVFNTVYNC